MEKILRSQVKEKLNAYIGSGHTKNVPGRTIGATYLDVNVVHKLATEELIEGGKADGLEDELFNKKDLDKGIKVEMEHTNNPEAAKEITKDHIKEESELSEKPLTDTKYYDLLDDLEEELKKASSSTKRLILQAVVKGGEFYKEIPPEVQKFISSDPARAQEFFKDKADKYPGIMKLIQQRLQKSQPRPSDTKHALAWKQKMVGNIVAMQKLVRDRALNNLHLVVDLDKTIEGNTTKDWMELTKLMAPQVVTAIRDNTNFTAPEFFKAFSTAGGDLSKIITVDRIL